MQGFGGKPIIGERPGVRAPGSHPQSGRAQVFRSSGDNFRDPDCQRDTQATGVPLYMISYRAQLFCLVNAQATNKFYDDERCGGVFGATMHDVGSAASRASYTWFLCVCVCVCGHSELPHELFMRLPAAGRRAYTVHS